MTISKSSIPKNKEELLEAITSVFEKLSVDYQSVPIYITRELVIEGNVKNTTVSICDTLAYLIGWGKLVLKWHDLKSKNEVVDFPETGFKWNQLGLLAQHFHEEYKEWEFEALQQEFTITVDSILVMVSALDNDDLYRHEWYEQWTLGRMIQFNTSAPMKNVRTKVRRFLKTLP